METPDTVALPAAARPAPGVLRLLQAARDRQERAGHATLGLNHLHGDARNFIRTFLLYAGVCHGMLSIKMLLKLNNQLATD